MCSCLTGDFVRWFVINDAAYGNEEQQHEECPSKKNYTYFAGTISYYLREGPFLVHETVVISSIYEHIKVDL